jgi:DNA repair protein RadD
MTITLRDYQAQAIQSIWTWFSTRDGNPLIELPTGTGKSLVIAGLCQQVLEQYEDSKILVVTHVRELIAQNYAELLRLWPGAPSGINSAGIGRRDFRQKIIFCGIQSVADHAHKFGKVDLILVDEAHLIPRDGATRYQQFISDLRAANPYARVIGLTATPYRLDSGRLDQGDDALFSGTAYSYPVVQAIKSGYLSPLVSKATGMKLDVAGVGTRGGDYIAGDLERAVNIDSVNRAAIREVTEFAARDGRRSWLIFAAGVDHAQALAGIVREHGVSVATIFGDTPKAERDATIAAFKRGEITCLVSMGVLTTGFNAPAVDLIAMLRPTQSTGLYVQICGRGMRLAQGKSNCLVLDFAGNILRHGPIDAVAPKGKGKGDGEGEAPVKECPSCGSYVHASSSECPDCGHVFPKPEPKIASVADTSAILSDSTPKWVSVTGMSFARHSKLGKPDSLRVTYTTRTTSVSEWICLEHDGYARDKARAWWKRRASSAAPSSVTEGMRRLNEIRQPSEIKVRQVGRYFEVLDARDMPVRQK